MTESDLAVMSLIAVGDNKTGRDKSFEALFWCSRVIVCLSCEMFKCTKKLPLQCSTQYRDVSQCDTIKQELHIGVNWKQLSY